MHIHELTPNFIPIWHDWDMCIQVTTVIIYAKKVPGDEFPVKIWQITGTGFNWVQAHSQNLVFAFGFGNVAHCCLPDITGCAALAVWPDGLNAKYHNKCYIQLSQLRPVQAKFKHVTNIETCMLLCCDHIAVWKALDANMVKNGARYSDKNVKILVRYQWISWLRQMKKHQWVI